MLDAAKSPAQGALSWCFRQPVIPPHKLQALRPDFLVIAPPKTGSSWLAANLRCHPGIFVPAIKEIRYFSRYFNALDFSWYLDHFAPAQGRVKGEASPSYAILPVDRIRLLRRLLPDLKLIYLMREPIARAWSHAKHNFRHKEANFAQCTIDLEAVSEQQWSENFSHEWPLAGGDYLGQLRRWLTVFPREQVYVGFYESIRNAPEKLLRDILGFLGVDQDVNWSGFRLWEKVLPGLPGELTPILHRRLQEILADRTRRLDAFLSAQLGLQMPAEWQQSLAASQEFSATPIPVFDRDADDAYLTRILGIEESFPAGPRLVERSYRGYNLFFLGNRLFALSEAVCPGDLEGLDEASFQRLQESDRCYSANSLVELKAQLNHKHDQRGLQ
jgi:hypothetical protein